MSAANMAPLPIGCKGYNCYWWAINRVAGSFNSTDPPGMEERMIAHTIVDLARATVQGLLNEGAHGAIILGALTDNELQEEINSLLQNQYLIAVRINTAVGGDYHYMRLEDDHSWTHKQGLSGMLFKLNGITPNDDNAWRSYNGNPFTGVSTLLSSELKYTSQTWYIRVTI